MVYQALKLKTGLWSLAMVRLCSYCTVCVVKYSWWWKAQMVWLVQTSCSLHVTHCTLYNTVTCLIWLVFCCLITELYVIDSWLLSANKRYKHWSFPLQMCLQAILYEWLIYIIIVCVHTCRPFAVSQSLFSKMAVCFCINLYDSGIGVQEAFKELVGSPHLLGAPHDGMS